MYKIEEGLYQGGRPRDLPPEITAVMNLEAATDVPVVVEDISCQVMLPIEDGFFPGILWLEMAVAILESLHKGGKVVYVHCRAGISRSSMVVAAYLMKKNNWGVDKALNYIAEKNPKIDPNPYFMVGLKEWDKKRN